MQRKTRIKFNKRTRRILLMVMIVAGFIMNGVMTTLAAPMAQTGSVAVTVSDANGVYPAGQVVYAFDGTAYTGNSASTDAVGVATFPALPAGNYRFATDLNGTRYYSDTANHCTVPTCTSANLVVPVFGTVDVTVTDGAPYGAGQVVYAFDGTAYSGKSATTNASGIASLTLPAGNYRFATDLNGTRYYSDTANHCTIPGCATATLTVPVFGDVDVLVEDAGGPYGAGQVVYAFDGTAYTGFSAQTDATGIATLTLPTGNYRFATDVNGTRYYSNATNNCAIPGCLTSSITVPVIGGVAVTVSDANGVYGAGQVVYAFDGTAYTGFSAQTDASGVATLTLPDGNYRFATDLNGTRYYSDTANHCTVPACATADLIVPVFGTVDVTVSDAGGPYGAGQVVYAFDGTTYTGFSATTNASGIASLTLPAGSYRFRTDVNGELYFSDTANHCTIPGCTTASLVVPVFGTVDVTVNDLANNPLPNQTVYAFDGTAYTGFSAQTDASGLASFNLPAGDYRFATDVYGIRHYSDTINHCTVTGCVSATLTVQATTLPAATCTETAPGARTCDLWATTGTTSLPDGTDVPIWGYSDSATGDAQLPGPMLIVNEGETITINLTNLLSEDTSMYFPGMEMVPDFAGAAANGGTATYTFVASAAGTHMYEAGLLPGSNYQVAMGMNGALIIRPSTPGQAYAGTNSAFDDEALLVLGEIDINLNTSATPSTFDMRDYKPQYWLINGLAFPNTLPIPTIAGHNVLLRYVNAGVQNHTPALLGLDQMILANDGFPYTYTRSVVSKNMGPGETMDMMVDIPATIPDGSKMPLYDSGLILHNNNAAGFGGMVTFITTAAGPAGPDTIGPTTSAVALSQSPTDGTIDVQLTASESDVATGNANIAAAEYFIDATGADGTGTAMTATDLAFDSAVEGVEATITAATIAGMTPGDHIIYVHGQDALGNWGSFNLVTLRLELSDSGPQTRALTLIPNPNAGDVGVALSGTADDSATGNSNIIGAEYFIGTIGTIGSGTPMTVNLPIPIASIDTVIPASTLTTEGITTIHVHSQDAFGIWGPMETIDFEVDLTGPVASTVTIAPNPNNGSLPINPSLFAARLDALLTDELNANVQSNLYRAEFFIDATDVDGTGIPMYARDGLFNTPNEEAYALISLVNINALADGPHTIYVHGQDASGNWGPFSSTVLVIERDLPTVTGTTATPNPTNGATLVDLTAVATDAGSVIEQAEWFVDADPGTGNGTAMSITPNAGNYDLAATIDVTGWAAGNYTLYTRARDAAGTWSLTNNVVLNVNTEAPIYGVTLAPPTAALPGSPGATVTYLLDVTNTGNGDDTFAITILGNAWTTTFPATVGPLTAGASAQISVDVTIPAGAGAGDADTVTVTATSQGSATATASSDLTTSAIADLLYFSTVANSVQPGVAGPADDADIYSWDGTSFSRIFDASAAGLPGNADIDGLTVVDADTFYMSFNRNLGVNVPGIGIVDDEDIVLYDAGAWSLYFDGNEVGLGDNNGEDVDAIEVLTDGSVALSAVGTYNPDPDFPLNRADEDAIYCVPNNAGPITDCTWIPIFDGSDVGLNNGGSEDVNGIAYDGVDYFLSTVGTFAVTGLSGNGADVFSCNSPTSGEDTACASFTMYFDGSAEGMVGRIDAFDIP